MSTRGSVANVAGARAAAKRADVPRLHKLLESGGVDPIACRDDGCVVFWRKARFLGSRVSFIGDPTDDRKASVVAELLDLKTSQTVAIVCAHLKSGDADSNRATRMKQLTGASILVRRPLDCKDTEVHYDVDGIIGAATCLRRGFFRNNFCVKTKSDRVILLLDTNEAYGGVCSKVIEKAGFRIVNKDQITSFKIRGPLTEQRTKMGQLVMIVAGSVVAASDDDDNDFALVNKTMDPADAAAKMLLPNDATPSDHFPVIVTFKK